MAEEMNAADKRISEGLEDIAQNLAANGSLFLAPTGLAPAAPHANAHAGAAAAAAPASAGGDTPLTEVRSQSLQIADTCKILSSLRCTSELSAACSLRC
jgi:hypothetical protein